MRFFDRREFLTRSLIAGLGLAGVGAVAKTGIGSGRAAAASKRRPAEDVSGAGAQTMLGFLASLRSDPEVADVYRETKIAQMHEHLRSRLAARRRLSRLCSRPSQQHTPPSGNTAWAWSADKSKRAMACQKYSNRIPPNRPPSQTTVPAS